MHLIANCLPSIDTIKNITIGIKASNVQVYQIEKSLRNNSNTSQSDSNILIPVIQCIQNYDTLKLAEQAWESVTKTPVSPLIGRLSLASVFIPLAVNGLLSFADLKRKDPRAQKILQYMQNNSSKVNLAISAISCLAIAFFGNPLVGGFGLATIGAQILSEQPLVPSRVRVLLRDHLKNIQISTLFISCFSNIPLAMVAFTCLSVRDLWSYYKQNPQKRPLQRVNAAMFTEQATPLNVQVDKLHIEDVVKLGQEPHEDLTVLLKNLTSDEKLKKKLELLSHKIINKQILDEEPWDYTPLRIRAKQNAIAIARLSNHKRSEELTKLALVADYNGKKMLAALENQYVTLLTQTPQTLEEKIQGALIKLRDRKYQEIVRKTLAIFRDSGAKEEDIYRLVDNYTADFGQLPSRPRNPDIHPWKYALLKSIVKYALLKSIVKTEKIEEFVSIAWNEYTIDNIKSAVENEDYENFELEMQQWFTDWGKRENVDLSNWNLDQHKNLAWKIMLTEMGIFKLNK